MREVILGLWKIKGKCDYPDKKREYRIIVECRSCGKTKEITEQQVKKGLHKHCSCISVRKNLSLYNCYQSMILRCYNPKSHNYQRYGYRGIKVCNEWLKGFYAFCLDMKESYKKGLSLERIDNNKGYYPDNCKWATPKEQANNRRNNFIVDEEGTTLKEYCERENINYRNEKDRIWRKRNKEKTREWDRLKYIKRKLKKKLDRVPTKEEIEQEYQQVYTNR